MDTAQGTRDGVSYTDKLGLGHTIHKRVWKHVRSITMAMSTFRFEISRLDSQTNKLVFRHWCGCFMAGNICLENHLIGHNIRKRKRPVHCYGMDEIPSTASNRHLPVSSSTVESHQSDYKNIKRSLDGRLEVVSPRFYVQVPPHPATNFVIDEWRKTEQTLP